MTKPKHSAKFNKIEQSLNSYYFERKSAIRAVSVGLLSNLNVIMVGPPGTAKTDISQAWCNHIKGADYFGTTLSAYTGPDEVLGAVDVPKWKNESIMQRNVQGYLPSAHLVAIEEIFKAGKGLLNSLIEVAHPSRLFSNGPERKKTPILTIIGTSNELPVGEQDLAAIYDRMTIKVYVKNIDDPNSFKSMVENTQLYDPTGVSVSIKDIQEAREIVNNIDISDGVLERITILRENLFKDGVFPSDRTWKYSLRSIKAQAFLEGRTEIVDDDILFLKNVLWHDPSEEKAVWHAIIDLIKPELKAILEILDNAEKATQEALSRDDNLNELVGIHQKLRSYIEDVKETKQSMHRKKKNVDEADDVIRKLKGLASKISIKLLGEETETEAEEDSIF